jgi:hypothetical protein
VLLPSGALTDVAHVSPMTEALGRQLGFRRIHFDIAYREIVRAAAAT